MHLSVFFSILGILLMLFSTVLLVPLLLAVFEADPTAHGTGIAGQLMAEVLGRATSRGAKSVWLGVNGMNERAQRFYAKHGFKVIGDRKFVVGDRTEDDLVFEHEL